MERRALTHAHVADDLPAYVLGVLDPEASAAVSAHVAECPICQAERRRFEDTLGVLGTIAPGVDPVPDLRARLLARLDEPAPLPASGPTPVDPVAPARSGIPAWFRLGLAAAAALVIGLGIWAAILARDLSRTRGDLAALQQQQIATQALLADPARAIPLVADNAPDAYGTLYVGYEENHAVLVARRLPPTPPNRVYQIWLVRGDTRVSAGVFTVNTSGSATVMIDAPAALTSYQRMGITEEPGPSGSPTPTGPRIVSCPLS